MKDTEKQAIADLLKAYCDLKGSQNKAAASLNAVSAATISQIFNGNWELITEEMWRNIAAQIGYDPRKWVVIQTQGYTRMYDLLQDAQENALVLAVTGDAGCGKSQAIQTSARQHRDVFVLSCSEYWNRKQFFAELLQVMGVEATGSTVAEMVSEAVYNLKRKATPIIVMDEADKLSDQVLYFFISLYNKLEDQCGIVICATDYLKKRITRGVKANRKGYKEIYSRVGRKFIPMPVVNNEDVAAVCIANGVTDRATIEEIIDDCECDLRRVKRRVHAAKKEALNGN